MKKITLLMAALFMAVGMNAQFNEDFDDISLLFDWDFVNVSQFVGTTSWFQGNPTVFPAFNGADDSYIGVNFNSGAGTGTLSNWMITPTLALSDGDEVKFYTRTVAGSAFPDRLEVRLSTAGDSSNDPFDSADVGSYTNLLVSVNENLEVGGYPEDWTEFTITLSGIGTGVDCRVAFRYFVTNGGPTGANSNYIGIDAVEITQNLSVTDNNIDGFNHYFNPQSQNLTINASEPFNSISIFNVLGQQVVNKNLSSTNEVINLSSVKSGVYIVNVIANGKTTTFKLAKK